MTKIRTIKELEKEVSELEEAALRKSLEKKLEQLKKADSKTLSNGKTVEIRKPTIKDMRLMEEGKTEAEKELILMRNLTGLTQEEIDALYTEDYAIYQGILQGFLS